MTNPVPAFREAKSDDAGKKKKFPTVLAMILSRRYPRDLTRWKELAPCLFCQVQLRSFGTSVWHATAAEKKPKFSPFKDAPRTEPARAPDDFTPKPLSVPIGLSTPPQVRENSSIYTRGWRQRRADFLNYDKHLERRKQL